MRFSLKDTFTLLNFHRRAKSDGFVIIPEFRSALSCDGIAQSTSLPNVEPAIIETGALRSSTSLTISHLSLPTRPTFYSDATIPELSVIRQRIRKLKEDNLALSEQVSTLTVEASLREKDCTQLQGDLLKEKLLTYSQEQTVEEQSNKLDEQATQIEQLKQLVSAVTDLGFEAPALEKAKEAVFGGVLTEDALVDAIKAAASKPGSTWARIFPAIVGPRTDDNYISAINLTLKTRRELKEARKVSRFWKKRAMADPRNEGVMTPSPSELSDVVEEMNTDRKAAIKELMKKRNLVDEDNLQPTAPLQEPEGNNSADRSTTPRLLDQQYDEAPPEDLPKTVTESPPLAPDQGKKHDSKRDAVLVEAITPTPPILAPLASQTFREERLATHSSGKLAAGFAKSKRPVLGTIDINREHRKSRTNLRLKPSVSDSKMSAKVSAKVHKKRVRKGKRLQLLNENQLTASSKRRYHSTTAVSSLSYHKSRNMAPNKHMDPSRSRLFRPHTSASLSIEEGRLEARSALASLERICASMSHISYKSIESQEESFDTDKSFSFEDPMKSTVSHSDSGLKLLSHTTKRRDMRSQNTTTNYPRTSKAQAMKDSMLPIYNRLVRWSSSLSLRRDSASAPPIHGYSPLNSPETTASSSPGTPNTSKFVRPSRLFTKRVTVPMVSSGITNSNVKASRSRSSLLLGRSSQSQMFLAAPAPRIDSSKEKGLADKSKKAVRSLSNIWS